MNKNNNSAIKRGNTVAVKIDDVKFPNTGIGKASEVFVPEKYATFTKDGIEKSRSADPEDKRRIFIKNVFKGQTVLARITKNRDDKVEAVLIEVLQRANYEIEPKCKHFGICGGCMMQSIAYKKQLEIKHNSVLKMLEEDFVRGFEYEEIISSPKEFKYRNKMEFSFGNEYKGGPTTLGFHKKNRYYDIVDVDDCSLMNDDFNKIRDFILGYVQRYNLSHYNRLTHEGYLRNLVIRQGENTGEILIGLAVTTQAEHDFGDLVHALSMSGGRGTGSVGDREISLSGVLVGFLIVENDMKGESVTGDYKILYGRDYYFEEMKGLIFKVSFYSFFQTNTGSAARLYDKVMEYAGDISGKTVYDLFSGTGTISQIVAMEGGRVIGVEIVSDAVKAANENALINGLDAGGDDIKFICGDVFEVLSKEELPSPDIIIVDPPRSGIAPSAFEKILSYETDEIIYISCNPRSMLTNIKQAQNFGYKLVRMGLVDQFPQSGHVECIALLSKLDSAKHISVELPIDEMDVTSAESKATYEQIKNYVLEKYGFKVSTLYIAQVKRKCGLEVREQYNVSKKENQVAPQCSAEREEAIFDALKYFKMLEY